MGMSNDEFDDDDKRRGISIEPFILPLLVLFAAVVSAFLASSAGSLNDMRVAAFTLAKDNQILQAFLASSVLGVVSYTIVTTGRMLMAWLRGRTFCSITIQSKDESFMKVIDYIGKQGLVSSGCLNATTYKKKKTWKDWRTEFLMGQRNPPRMDYQPANNNDVHIIHYAGARILMHRHKGETVVAGWERVPTQMESLTLSSFGSRVAPLKQLIDDALRASFEEQQDELNVFCLSDMWGGSWEKALSKKPRSIESVILDEDLASKLIADARTFLKSADWYSSVGIPYRRGFLLYGPPGCGKTSFCQALAGALKLDVCMLTLTNKNLDDNGLAEALRDAPANAIVLLEDVDAVFVDRSVSSDGSGRPAPGVTFSGLLNALDGVASQEGRLFFMTTNHIEKLDPALIRPGRCDVKVEVRRASRKQAKQLYLRFFEDATEADATAFADSLPEYELSMAALQGHLLEHRGDKNGALASVQTLLRASKPLHVDRMPVFDHLRRVGLEGWSKLFEYHGYNLKADLRGLSIDTVKSWSGYLPIDALTCKRMELLLSDNKALMDEYQYVDMATAKEMFLSVFGEPVAKGTNADEPLPIEDASSDDGSVDSKLPSPNKNTDDTTKGKLAPLLMLADKLCASLQVDGKAAASIWQLRRHLQLYAHSAEEAVATVSTLVTVSPPCGCDGIAIDEMSTYDWLRRIGLEKHAKLLEDQNYTTARSLHGLQESVLKELDPAAWNKEPSHLAKLKALCTADGSKARDLLSFTSPDYARLRDSFVAAFAAEKKEDVEAHATAFARSLTDGGGHGRISRFQLEAYLEKAVEENYGVGKAAMEAKKELLEHVRPEPPPAPAPKEPTEWVHSWLKGHGLERLAPKLIDARFVDEDDLKMEPKLTLEELEKLGVEKAAERRKLLGLIRGL